MSITKIFFSLCVGLMLLLAVIMFNTLTNTLTDDITTDYGRVELDREKISQHLSQAITFKTISEQNQAHINYAEFSAFIDWLAQTYPKLHSKIQPIRINNFTLLYQWPGQDQSLPPILLSGHYDVVPIIPNTESIWVQPPFAGIIDDTHIWGRGALDDKSAVIAMLEALTVLIEQNFDPQRTIYVAVTHDEEVGSEQGAAGIVEWMQANNVQPIWSLDEGSFVLNGLIPGVDKPVASINVAEKGFMNLQLTVSSEGGHSSMPKGHTAAGILSSAIHHLQNSPLEGSLEGVTEDMFHHLAPHMPFVNRMLFANTWLFSDLIESKLAESAGGNAMLRTTIAPTMLSGSIKANILPINASAVINFRLHPNDTVKAVVKHVTQAINDPRVTVSLIEGSPASQVSDYQRMGFKKIAAIAKHVHGEIAITPGLTVAATDSRKYEDVAIDNYRFNPMSIYAEDVAGFHGTNEKISIDNMLKATEFYVQLMVSSIKENESDKLVDSQ